MKARHPYTVISGLDSLRSGYNWLEVESVGLSFRASARRFFSRSSLLIIFGFLIARMALDELQFFFVELNDELWALLIGLRGINEVGLGAISPFHQKPMADVFARRRRRCRFFRFSTCRTLVFRFL